MSCCHGYRLINHEDDPSDDVDEFFPTPLGITPPKERRRRSVNRPHGSGTNGDYFLDDELDFYWLSPMGRYASHDDVSRKSTIDALNTLSRDYLHS